MKRFLAFIALGMLLISNTAYAQDTEETKNVMTVKQIQWSDEVVNSGENKLMNVKVDFHYEGDMLDAGYDYNFNVHCQITRNRRGGTKYLFYEIRDLYLDDPEIVGSKDFSYTYTFTFTPQEFGDAKKRAVTCNLGYSNDENVKTVFAEGADYGQKFKVRNNKWKKLK